MVWRTFSSSEFSELIQSEKDINAEEYLFIL